MEQNTKPRSVWAEIEPYCVLRRIWKNLWMVLLSAGLFALLAYIATGLLMKSSYTCTATFVVTPKYNSATYSAGSSTVAAGTAEQFASLLSSTTLTSQIRKEYGDTVSGTQVSSVAVKNTSLIQLNVTGPSPRAAFYMITGILDHYDEYARYVFDSVVLELVNEPKIPAKQSFSGRQRQIVTLAAPVGAIAMAALLALLTILSRTVQNVTGARNQVDGHLIVTLQHQRKHRTLKSMLLRRKTSLLISNPTTAFLYVETVHQLRSRVEHANRHHDCRTFLVASVGENEGKSTVAANLALSLAKKHQRVLLMDCDLRKAAQHLIFDAKPEKGKTLNALLKGELDPSKLVSALQYRKADNLFCLYSGNVARRAAELLSSERMKQLMAVLRENFDYVIVDSSPMGFFTDTAALADLTDASILVVRQDSVPDIAINDAIDDLSRCRARFLGYVFNDVHTLNLAGKLVGYGGRYGYGYGYSKGYGYGKRYGYGKGYGYGYGYGASGRGKKQPADTDVEVDGKEQ